MPSSKAALMAEIRTLRAELSSREAVISLQNGAMDEIGREIEQYSGGMIARIIMILERHGVRVKPQNTSPFQ